MNQRRRVATVPTGWTGRSSWDWRPTMSCSTAAHRSTPSTRSRSSPASLCGSTGPNRVSSFHVVGGIFERVFQDGSQTSPLAGVQTVDIPVGGGSIFELRLREPGDYPFVSHAFADATKGAVGVLRAVASVAAR